MSNEFIKVVRLPIGEKCLLLRTKKLVAAVAGAWNNIKSSQDYLYCMGYCVIIMVATGRLDTLN